MIKYNNNEIDPKGIDRCLLDNDVVYEKIKYNLHIRSNGSLRTTNLTASPITKLHIKFKFNYTTNFYNNNTTIFKSGASNDAWNGLLSCRNGAIGEFWIGYTENGKVLNKQNISIQPNVWYDVICENNKITINGTETIGTASLVDLNASTQIGGTLLSFPSCDMELEFCEAYNGALKVLDLSRFKSATSIVNKGSIGGAFVGTNCELVEVQ